MLEGESRLLFDDRLNLSKVPVDVNLLLGKLGQNQAKSLRSFSRRDRFSEMSSPVYWSENCWMPAISFFCSDTGTLIKGAVIVLSLSRWSGNSKNPSTKNSMFAPVSSIASVASRSILRQCFARSSGYISDRTFDSSELSPTPGMS